VVSLREPADRSDDIVYYRGLGVVLLAALLLRALFLYTAYTHDAYWDLLLLDAEIYREIATRIAGGDWIAGSEAYTLGPLYPYVLGLLLRMFGEGNGVAYIFQQLLGLGSIAMTGAIGRHCFGSRAGIAAAALMALYAPLPMMELKIMASTLGVFLALSGTLLLMRAHARRSLPGCLWSGVVLGLSCLARPDMLLFSGTAFLWLLWLGRRPAPIRLAPAFSLLLGLGLAIAPAAMRNYAVEGDLVLISSQGGITFYQGNNRMASGRYTLVEELGANPRDQNRRARDIAEAALGRPLRQSEVSAYWYDQGLRYLKEHPAKALSLAGWKALYWSGNQEISTEYLLRTERQLLPVLWLAPLPFGIVLALAIAGIRRTGKGQARHALLYMFIITNLVTVIAFFFSSRLRLPAVPFVCVLAGAGMLEVAARLRDRRRRTGLAVWLLPSFAILIASILPPTQPYRQSSANQHYNIGNVFYQTGRYEQAVDSYRTALEELDWKWEVHYNLGQTYRRLERWEEAAAEFQRVVDKRPEHPHARRHLEDATAKCRR